MLRRLFVFICIVLAFNASVTQASNGLNLRQFCLNHGYVDITNIDLTASGYRCIDKDGGYHKVDLDKACREAYGKGWKSHTDDPDDHNSVVCIQADGSNSGSNDGQGTGNQPNVAQPSDVNSGNSNSGGGGGNTYRHEDINVDGYCKHQGFQGDVLLGQQKAGDRLCFNGGHDYRQISMADACMWQYGLPYVGLRDGNDPNSWYCTDDPNASVSNVPETWQSDPRVTGQDGGGGNPPPQQPNNQGSSNSGNSNDPGFAAHAAVLSEDRSGGCSISSFTMDPVGPYIKGQEIHLHLESNCGTTRFSVSDNPKAETGQSTNNETLKTSELNTGDLVVCAVGHSDGDWSVNFARRCLIVYVGPQSRIDQYNGNGNNGGSNSGSSSNNGACSGESSSRLGTGMIAVATTNVLMRENASRGASILAHIGSGSTMTIIGGPTCSEGFTWWETQYPVGGPHGWVAEIQNVGSRYLIAPNGTSVSSGSSGGNTGSSSGNTGGNTGSGSGSTNTGGGNENLPPPPVSLYQPIPKIVSYTKSNTINDFNADEGDMTVNMKIEYQDNGDGSFTLNVINVSFDFSDLAINAYCGATIRAIVKDGSGNILQDFRGNPQISLITPFVKLSDSQRFESKATTNGPMTVEMGTNQFCEFPDYTDPLTAASQSEAEKFAKDLQDNRLPDLPNAKSTGQTFNIP